MYNPPEMLTRQKSEVPAIYGNVDFTVTPERYAGVLEDVSELSGLAPDVRAELLQDEARMAKIRMYTMMGDVVADAYAALIPEYGFRKLVSMLETACDEGLSAVDTPPRELVHLIESMEKTPDWLNMDLVEEGARMERNEFANFVPYAIRGTFLATFMNAYAALPMAMTGTLSNTSSAGRVKETANFFTTTVMPGALARGGAGFKAAAKVRLMHSMVRFNIMRTNRWDVGVYGTPIPQVDQMPAGMVGMFFVSAKLLKKGRTTFNQEERAKVELARFRCFLLGLPADLLADDPQEIVDLMLTRQATLRKAWDDDTCGELVRSTVNAVVANENLLSGPLRKRMELSLSKLLLVKNHCAGDYSVAADMGVDISAGDKIIGSLTALVMFGRLYAYRFAMKVPGLADITDRHLIRKLTRLLKGYGRAKFESNSEQYKPASGATASTG